MKPAWLEIAEKEIGVCEKKGGESARIIEYHSATSLKAKEDEIPWCAAFVNWCLVQSDIAGTNSAAAKSFLDWGQHLEAPKEGCICVVQQRQAGRDQATGSTSGFHVAFWLGESDGRVKLLGGNQSDSVKISTFGLQSYKIAGYRWPVQEAS